MSERRCADFFPRIFTAGDVSSCLDVAFELARQGRLNVWDSLIVKSQSAGRGQLRRPWSSPPGNLYAALSLPLSPPFDSSCASVAVGTLLASAFRAFGLPVLLKWPNDLVLGMAAVSRKIGGILLEERGEILLAGIGINIVSAPSPHLLRNNAAMPATCLAEAVHHPPPSAKTLWQQLVKRAYSVYAAKNAFSEYWKDTAEQLLLWRDCQVRLVADKGETVYGNLTGLALSGGIRLRVGGETREFTCGELRLA